MTPTNHTRLSVFIETESAQVQRSPTGQFEYITVVQGDNEVVLVFNRVSAARVLRVWADRMEALNANV